MNFFRSRRYNKPHVGDAAARSYPPGTAAALGEFQAGDFILTHGRSFFSYLIRIGQYLRFWGANAKYTWWSHAALVVSPQGDLIEAVGAGVIRSNISKYAPTDFHVVRLGSLATGDDRVKVVAYGEWTVGQGYGFVTIVSITISLLVGGSFTFGFDGQSICSGLVARALERTRAIFDRSPSHILPADLARYFAVNPPPKGTSRGTIP